MQKESWIRKALPQGCTMLFSCCYNEVLYSLCKHKKIGCFSNGRIGSLIRMMTPFRRIALAVFAGILLMGVTGYLLWPRGPKAEVDYKMPGNPRPKILAAG